MIPVAGNACDFSLQPIIHYTPPWPYLPQTLPTTCLLDAFLLQAPNPREFSLYSLRMCRDSRVQACVLLRPILNVFECFSGVERAEHKESNDCVVKWGRLRKLQKTAAWRLSFWIHLKQINTFDDEFFIKKAERSPVLGGEGFCRRYVRDCADTVFLCPCLCFLG